MLAVLNDYDWEQVFKYCTSPTYERGCAEVDTSGFTRDDVTKVHALVAGDNDGPDWVAVMELSDGRFAYVSAGCDYTGWG